MERFFYDWFEIVEEQSDKNVAILAINDVELHIEVKDPNGFLVVNVNKIPAELKPFIDRDSVAPIVPFRYRNKVLLQNNKLSKYLALAKAFKEHYSGDFEYVEVLFKRKEEDNPSLVEHPLDLKNLDSLLGNAPLFSCWESFRTQDNKGAVAQLVIEAEKVMNDKSIKLTDDHTVVNAKMFGSFIMTLEIKIFLAVIHAWLKNFQKARDLMASTGVAPMRFGSMATIVRYYLEMLMVYEQAYFLADFFSNEMLLKTYLTHYEIYKQDFLDPDFVCTRIQQVSVVRQRMEDFRERDAYDS
ncbi:MAG: hypothetical protein KKE39_07130 [Bacteroidetes bacterium]|nr:hypothetical protein [Bacteroidota bacterium]MBU1372949.1 hypothetical protein [Bacteroidota bacterium]MBU1484213.1 hypothetical protein [Bacteroidota bacterium]MBU1761372.1 hypothetical protein [Bacteroidota bacterium]MBU2046176.1 hypothetical protein [Bacteroidota bacterium]